MTPPSDKSLIGHDSLAMQLRRVVVIYDYGWINGGAAQVAVASAVEMRRRGLEVTFFCAVGPVDGRLSKSNINVVCLDQFDVLGDPKRLRAAISGIWNSAAALSLSRLLMGADPASTILHIHGWTKALSASVFRVIRRLGFKVVVTLHDYFTACPNGGLFDYPGRAACSRRPMSLQCIVRDCDSRSYAHKVWRVARQGVATAVTSVHGALSDVIYVSMFSRELLQGYFGESTRWHFVPNPVEAAAGARVSAESNRNFLFIGRLSPEKGVDLFCTAAAIANVPVEVVGDGEEGNLLRSRWPAVAFTGWLDAPGVQARLSEARVLVLPSLCYETQGLVVQEALARGVPVVVADRTGARDAVRPGVNGLIFKQGDVRSLAASLRELADDDLVRRMSFNAHSGFWAEPATIASHVDRLLVVYSDVMSGEANGGRVD